MVIIHIRIEDVALQNGILMFLLRQCVEYTNYLKKQLDFENDLLLSNCKDRISLLKIKCANSKLPIYKHIYIYDSDVI